jgi:aspartate aminotransferase
MPESTQNAEASSSKIDLTLPGFREDSGKIFIPPTVRHVEKQLRNERILLLDPLPIQGLESFLDVGNKLAYGAESPAYRKERVRLFSAIVFAKLTLKICSVQSFSVTGALRLASSFLARFPPTSSGRSIYVPNPTLPEDLVSLKASGMEIRQFRFLDQKMGGIDWEGLREDLMVS